MQLLSTPTDTIEQIVARQRDFFATHRTLPVEYRLAMLRRLRKAITDNEAALCEALRIDLNKSYEEAYLTEISIVLGEIDNFIKNLKRWAAPSKRKTPLKLLPSKSYIRTEPLGVALIIAPWNYPMQLLLNPLVGAIGAGCTAILKPSPYVPHVAMALERLIKESFDEEYIAIVQGHRDVNTALLRERYDIIFFTGSPDLGRVVMRAAAENLTPVVLELGGKSPVVVDRTADIALAAKRVAWGKTLNAGQTCIAPDYLLIHREVKEPFIEAYKAALRELHGEDASLSKHYVRMVSDRAFERVRGYLDDGRIRCGGEAKAEERYIEPTLLDNVATDSAVMREEIFGPVLPMIEIDNLDEAIEFILRREKPLALYVFADKRDAERVIELTSSGGACINDVIMHIANEYMPFGGVGNSGMGRYHGRDSLYSFSHRRSVLSTTTKIDLPFRYMPYRWFKRIKRLL
ncbi:MAG: aldehyde dehydrogenase [Rikenellaceae bacterium]|nr:aldehyde dehydrogenase [Rikenellaceae bacterium]